MKTALARAFVLLAVAACTSEAFPNEGEATGATTSGRGFANGKSASSEAACTVGARQKCGTCGTQTCAERGGAEIATTEWGPCEESIDACTPPPTPDAGPAPCPDGGDRAPDGSCPRKMELNVDGDCVCAPACPADAPFIVGCRINFEGSNTNGCVAPAKDGRIYFQEGVKCDKGHLSGFVLCSTVAGGPLDQNNCPINKSNPRFGDKPSNCPEIESGKPDSCFF